MSIAERNFVVEPSEDFLCPICAKVLVEPHVTECCGQHFCEQCLTQWFKEQGSVIYPHCRSINFAHIRYLPMKRKINDLQVFCSNKKDGCTSITTVSQLESHLSECLYATVKCSLNCGLSLLRKDVIGHRTNDCRNRISTCIYCKKMGKYYVITGSQHVMSCPDIPVGCPKNCPDGRSVKRKDLNTHKLICPLESVSCSDCLAEMQRQQLSEHRLNTCPKRIIICKHCKVFGAFDHITGQHVNECEEFPTGCPRKCQGSEQMKRKKVKSHSEVCPLEPVLCPFSEVGCKPQLVRRDLNSHIKSNLEQHMLKVMTSHTQLVAEHKGLKDDYLRLRMDHSKLLMDHRRLKSELAKSQAMHSEMAARFSNMTSSISHELEFIEKAQVQTQGGGMDDYTDSALALQCIKTALHPNLKDGTDKIVFRVPQLQTTEQKTSSQFYVLDGYKMCLVYKKIDEPLARRGVWNLLRPSDSIKINVSLHLMKGEKDDSLKWPINVPFTIHINLKTTSTDSWRRRTSQSNQYGLRMQSAFGGFNKREEQHMPCDKMEMDISLDHEPCINLDRVADEMSQELKCKSMISKGPLKAEITLSPNIPL